MFVELVLKSKECYVIIIVINNNRNTVMYKILIECTVKVFSDYTNYVSMWRRLPMAIVYNALPSVDTFLLLR